MTLRTAGKRASELTATALITLIILFVSMIPVSAAERHEPHGQGQGMGWGDNGFGQLGDNTTTDRHTPVQIKGPGGPGHLEDVLSLAAGAMHNLALKSDGTVWAWGYNPDGRLGDNTTTDRTAPVQVAGPGGVGHLTGMVAIAAGYVHSLALGATGPFGHGGTTPPGSWATTPPPTDMRRCRSKARMVLTTSTEWWRSGREVHSSAWH
jgi:hypothetical protein